MEDAHTSTAYLGDTLDDAIRQHVLAMLAHYRGNRIRTAKALKMERRTLQRYLARYRDIGAAVVPYQRTGRDYRPGA